MQKTKAQSHNEALMKTLAGLKPTAARQPEPERNVTTPAVAPSAPPTDPAAKIFPEARPGQQIVLKLASADLAKIDEYLAAGRAAGRTKFNTSQAIRAMIRTSRFDLGTVDRVIAEDPRRKGNRNKTR